MRLRNISGSREIIGESRFVIHDPEAQKGNWHKIFGNNDPIRIEIGMGKGDVFGEGEVDRIYLNFSDPWPKDRHAKRRLPSREFLARYDGILKEDGQIEFKTDNEDLFRFALEELEPAGWKAERVSYDLHHDVDMRKDNIMTEYEERFSSMGNPIYKYVIVRQR